MPTTTIDRPRVQTTNGGPPGRLSLTPVRRRRQRSWILAGVIAMVVGAAGMSAVVGQFGHRESVLVLADSIGAGHVLQASDLSTADVSNDSGITFVDATTEQSVIGRPVAVPLAAGTPLVQSDLGAPLVTDPNAAVVAVLVKSGQAPPALAPGDRVEVVQVATSSGSATTTTPVGAAPVLSGPVTATVIAIDQPTDSAADGTIISLQLPVSDATAVAQAAASGGVSLIALPPGS